ncbi:uncharacterized protein LOC119676994 [Teleopsis dalmanni]|uniref:uncharacterized protein LOC119676994 n=1 Tax=Teleopsis dalmanni TaxID=139649 RepID=UPI0018CD8882|nr:uncharacterized protein LOC119676994 [Teleopsis dalmanni]
MWKKANGYKPFVINTTIDTCRYLAGKTNPIVDVFFDIWRPYTNINHSCPYSGDMVVEKVPLNSFKAPSAFPEGNYRVDLDVAAYGQNWISNTIFVDSIKCNEYNKSLGYFAYCDLKPAHFTMWKKANGYKPFVINITLDACKYLDGKRNPTADVFYDIWKSYTNINHSCPYTSDMIVEKVPLYGFKAPSAFPEGNYRVDFDIEAYGSPQPDITWKIKGIEFSGNDRMRILNDGSLLIKSVNRQDAGDYSCHAENSIAKDSITHKLIVLAPPQSPQVSLSATTTDSLTVKLKPHEGDTAPLHGYTLHYKPEFGEWETAEVSVDAQKFSIDSLLCGSRYQVYATGFNNIGAGEASDILNTRTKGYKPKLPEKSRFIEVSSNSVSLHFKAWKDGGCPMSHFVVENKKRDQIEWNQISNNVKPDNNYVVLDLEPATWYNLRITAHNSAGFTVAEYDFATLTVTGGTIAPLDDGQSSGNIHTRIRLPAWMPEWLDLNFMVPLIATVIVVAVGILVVCVALSRRRADDLRGGQKDVYYDVVYNQTMGPGATLDKRRPDLRDELGYIAPPNRKLPPVPGSNYNTCDRIKRGRGLRSNHSTWDPRRPNLYEELKPPPVPLHGNVYGHGHGTAECHYRHPGMEDEICPYATFHLLGFREEMDPTKAMNFQTFPHQNGHAPGPGHAGTMGPPGHPGHMHSRSGSQSMPRANRYARKNSQGGQSSIYTPAPEYDDPANCAEEDQYDMVFEPRVLIQKEGLVLVRIRGIYVCSCYICPNISQERFEEFLDRLSGTIRNKTPIIVAGDFNAWAVEWGSSNTTRRGRALLETFTSLNLIQLNNGHSPTFDNGRGVSYIDLTFVSPSLVRGSQWNVTNHYTHSDHHAILFSLSLKEKFVLKKSQRKAQQIGWKTKYLDTEIMEFMTENMSFGVGVAFEKSNHLMKELCNVCDASMPRKGRGNGRSSNYWWTEEIALLRSQCFASRRQFQRHRSGVDAERLLQKYGESRSKLKKAIIRSKNQAFQTLINDVDQNVWGDGYKIVMRKFKRLRGSYLHVLK